MLQEVRPAHMNDYDYVGPIKDCINNRSAVEWEVGRLVAGFTGYLQFFTLSSTQK